jgi:hypothetical protein
VRFTIEGLQKDISVLFFRHFSLNREVDYGVFEFFMSCNPVFALFLMESVQTSADYSNCPWHHDCRRFHLAAAAFVDIGSAAIDKKTLELCRKNKSLVKNPFPVIS